MRSCAHHAGEAVAAQQEHVAAARLMRVHVELDVGLRPERARDDRIAADAPPPPRS